MDFLANDYGLEISRYGINGDQLSPSGARIIMVAQDPRPQIKPWGPNEIISVAQTMGGVDARYRDGLVDVKFDTSDLTSSPIANLEIGRASPSGVQLTCTIKVGNLDVFTPDTSNESKATVEGLRKFVLYHELAHCEQGAARSLALEQIKKNDFSFSPTTTTSLLGELMHSFNSKNMSEVDARQINDLNNERHSDSVALLKISKDVLGSDVNAPDFSKRMETMEDIFQKMNSVRIKMAKYTVDNLGGSFQIHNTQSTNVATMNLIRDAAKSPETHKAFQDQHTTPQGANDFAAKMALAELSRNYKMEMTRLLNTDVFMDRANTLVSKEVLKHGEEIDANAKGLQENCNPEMKATDIYKIASSNLEQLRIIRELSEHQASKNVDYSMKDGGDIKPLKVMSSDLPGFKDFLEESNRQYAKAISMNDDHKKGEAQIYENFGKRDVDLSGHESIKSIKSFNATASSIIQSCGVKSAIENKKSTSDLSMKSPAP